MARRSKADVQLERECIKLFDKAGLEVIGSSGGTKILGKKKSRQDEPEKQDGGQLASPDVQSVDAVENAVPSGDRTREDRWRAWVGQQMVKQVLETEQEKTVLSDLESKATDARKAASEQRAIVEAGEKKLQALAMDMVRIEQGTYTPPLFDDQGDALALPAGNGRSDDAGLSDASESESGAIAPDPALTTPLTALLMSDTNLEKLQQSQLAVEYKLVTIADLERSIREDEWWYRKVKGFGPAKVEQLVDALTDWRLKNPVPTAEDGRVKQCTNDACQDAESLGFFVDGKCPECGKEYFHLVDRSDYFSGDDDGDEEGDDE